MDVSTIWVPVPRTQKGWASRFGDLIGIDDIRPPKRIEVVPFLVGSSTLNSNRDPRSNYFVVKMSFWLPVK